MTNRPSDNALQAAEIVPAVANLYALICHSDEPLDAMAEAAAAAIEGWKRNDENAIDKALRGALERIGRFASSHVAEAFDRFEADLRIDTQAAKVGDDVDDRVQRIAARMGARFVPNAPTPQPAVAEAVVELLRKYQIFAGETAGKCLGLAMSTDHPDPDSVLMGIFHASQELAAEAAAIRQGQSAGEGR
ncbi:MULTISPECIES: hypothetical protein [unclassified Sphingomonas]|uniref:hypothetical protein n=1 Tax=unclassified Sphingomonas TaxID=196159 RepID=UPI0006F88C91|nr:MULTISPECIES: hypothetical protein [unclassified Sphingomonas]KQX18372.1 hypothetical protein ASD17_14520 [Sphingomonas sp. Root1294]KQY72303.1 hypothetical protein ASD39_20455 [Sphingomonas sp. Root50]KRB94426.1 hypothetical protein ASE22_00295 [Sphingomonas sp. Root720]